MLRNPLHRLRKRWAELVLTPRTYPEYLRSKGAVVGNQCQIFALRLHVGIEVYLLKIGDRVVIEDDVICITHDGAAWVFRHLVPDLQVYGSIVIEDDCRIGAGALLCPGIRIGRGAVVGPGSLVISNVPRESFFIGVPARACTLDIPTRAYSTGS